MGKCTAQISTTLKDLKDAGVMVPSFLHLIPQSDLTKVRWILKISYSKPNQIFTLNVHWPAVVSLVQQINKSSATWYTVINLVNIFFSIPIRKEDQK